MTYLALNGHIDQLRDSLFRWQDVVRDALLGGAFSGAAYGVSKILNNLRSPGKVIDPLAELPVRTSPSDKTSGIYTSDDLKIQLESGWEGPASQMPRGSQGFGIVTRTHVEGHTAAIMQQKELISGTLIINNQPCPSCVKYYI